MIKFLKETERICLFCGEQEIAYFEEAQLYYECNCKDAIETRDIMHQINELKSKLPNHKYCITKELVLNKINN